MNFILEFPECKKHEFRCSTGQCLDKTFTCNGVGECPDTSDEVNCTAVFPKGRYCPQDTFHCDNHVCCCFILNKLV